MKILFLCILVAAAVACSVPATSNGTREAGRTTPLARATPVRAPTLTPLPYHDVAYLEGIAEVSINSRKSEGKCALYVRFESASSANPGVLSDYRFEAYWSPDIGQWNFQPVHELRGKFDILNGVVRVQVTPKELRDLQSFAMGRQAGVRLIQRGRYRGEEEWRRYYSNPIPIPNSFYNFTTLPESC